jgi:hypothetical protein
VDPRADLRRPVLSVEIVTLGGKAVASTDPHEIGCLIERLLEARAGRSSWLCPPTRRMTLILDGGRTLTIRYGQHCKLHARNVVINGRDFIVTRPPKLMSDEYGDPGWASSYAWGEMKGAESEEGNTQC